MKFEKGRVPWNKGKKYSLGYHWTDEQRKKQSEKLTGITRSAQTRKKISASLRALPEEIKLKKADAVRKAQKGKISPMRGKKGKPSTRKGMIFPDKRGENSPNWKGGYKDENYRERRRFRNSMQKAVFERDNYTCQICGIRGGDLQVDHIQSWAEYVDLRFSMDNCRTICAGCHYKITFGKPMSEKIRGWGHNLLKGESSL